MATFTMNSQKTFVQAKGASAVFDKAFAFSVVLIILVGGIWGVERLMIYLTDRQIAEYQATTAASLDSVSAEDVQAVNDVASRLATINAGNNEKMATGEILNALERSTIPQSKLTSYEQKSDGTILISGVVADYRFLAEQILRYRQEKLFAAAEVTTSDRTEDGQITFQIEVQAPPAPVVQETVAPAPVI